MKLKPLHDRVIVKPEAPETTTPSGIVLPDSAQERPLRGKVVAVGPGRRLDDGKIAPLDLKPKETVLYGKYAGTEVTLNGEEYVILRAEDVLAVVESSGK